MKNAALSSRGEVRLKVESLPHLDQRLLLFAGRGHEIIDSGLRLREMQANEVLMKSYIFKVAIEPDKFEDGRDAWHAFCPALKGCHTWGHTHEEALANLRDAIDLYVQDLIEAGEQIPVSQGTIELPEPAVVVNV